MNFANNLTLIAQSSNDTKFSMHFLWRTTILRIHYQLYISSNLQINHNMGSICHVKLEIWNSATGSNHTANYRKILERNNKINDKDTFTNKQYTNTFSLHCIIVQNTSQHWSIVEPCRIINLAATVCNNNIIPASESLLCIGPYTDLNASHTNAR